MKNLRYVAFSLIVLIGAMGEEAVAMRGVHNADSYDPSMSGKMGDEGDDTDVVAQAMQEYDTALKARKEASKEYNLFLNGLKEKAGVTDVSLSPEGFAHVLAVATPQEHQKLERLASARALQLKNHQAALTQAEALSGSQIPLPDLVSRPTDELVASAQQDHMVIQNLAKLNDFDKHTGHLDPIRTDDFIEVEDALGPDVISTYRRAKHAAKMAQLDKERDARVQRAAFVKTTLVPFFQDRTSKICEIAKNLGDASEEYTELNSRPKSKETVQAIITLIKKRQRLLNEMIEQLKLVRPAEANITDNEIKAFYNYNERAERYKQNLDEATSILSLLAPRTSVHTRTSVLMR